MSNIWLNSILKMNFRLFFNFRLMFCLFILAEQTAALVFVRTHAPCLHLETKHTKKELDNVLLALVLSRIKQKNRWARHSVAARQIKTTSYNKNHLWLIIGFLVVLNSDFTSDTKQFWTHFNVMEKSSRKFDSKNLRLFFD